ncbi:hypothetical protein BGX34_008276 [Mortierella sp. NVP85]|nr:hypothetical protein BGX34_008276 [Mortierella sp. NVP85]
MSGHTSIFDIPHITELIASHLDQSDLLSCILVNKAFYSQFASLLWEELIFKPSPDTKNIEVTNDEQEKTWINNCQWTRHLTVNSKGLDYRMLTLLKASCTRLKTLNCYNMAMQGWDDADFEQLFALVERNTQLQSWSLLSCDTLSSDRLRQFSKVLSNVPSLTELKLDLLFHPRRGWLQFLLRSIPSSLRKLHINWGYLFEGSGDEEYPLQTWPERYPSMEDVDMAIFLTREEEQHFFNFLERCPALQHLAVPSIMTSTPGLEHFIRLIGSRSMFPNLIDLDLHRISELNERESRALLEAMEGRIKSFVAETIFSIPELVDKWSGTIESLQLHHLRASGEDIRNLIVTCKKLKRMDCRWPLMNEDTPPDTCFDSDLVKEYWITQDLEALRRMFIEDAQKSKERALNSMQDTWVVSKVEDVLSDVTEELVAN